MGLRNAPQAELLPARRRALILNHVRLRGAASIQELAEAADVSLSTVRRDLDALSEQGYLARTHGGALIEQAPAATFEPNHGVAARTAQAQKAAIGREAARRVTPGASVLADAGTTVLEAVRCLVDRGLPLTLVTNGLDAAMLCRNASAIRALIVGGALRTGSSVLTGEPALSFLGQLHVDLCLLGAHAVSNGTVTETSLEGAAIKQAMRRAARGTILLADSGKFRHAAFCTVCDVSEFDEVITDDGIDPTILAGLRERGVTVSVVATEPEP
jgi:DeoR/GlpR family transcriptional regulator of sugar metabolism